ncbi:MAG TPA: hypothetical protein VHX20_12160 [Terracidiphilus sp.]|jgi:hypothetical protein|nr:hypothetical protein [Terracidiphilus sp.]
MNSSFDAAEASTLPHELAGPLPRRTRMSGSGVANAVYAMVLLVLALAGALWFGRRAEQQIEHRAALRQEGSDATGEVTEVSIAGRSSNLLAKYTFAVNGTFFTGEALVPKEMGHNLRELSLIPIRYLPANPTVNHPSGWEESSLSIWIWPVLPAIPAALGILFFAALRAQRRLIAHGISAAAAITACSRSRAGFNVKYNFVTKDGQVVNRSGLFETRQEIGARIVVVYLPQNPRRSQPYPLDFYRVAE